MSKKSYKERRLARQAREQKKKDNLKTSEEARRAWVQTMGQAVISQNGTLEMENPGIWVKEGNNYRYITSDKTFRDVSAVWRRFSQFVAEKSAGNDLDSLDSILKYADRYLQSCVDKNLSAWTLTTYKTHLGKVFGLSTAAFIETKPRQRADIKRSRHDVESDKHISQAKHDFSQWSVGQLVCANQKCKRFAVPRYLVKEMRTGFIISRQKGKGASAQKSYSRK